MLNTKKLVSGLAFVIGLASMPAYAQSKVAATTKDTDNSFVFDKYKISVLPAQNSADTSSLKGTFHTGLPEIRLSSKLYNQVRTSNAPLLTKIVENVAACSANQTMNACGLFSITKTATTTLMQGWGYAVSKRNTADNDSLAFDFRENKIGQTERVDPVQTTSAETTKTNHLKEADIVVINSDITNKNTYVDHSMFRVRHEKLKDGRVVKYSPSPNGMKVDTLISPR